MNELELLERAIAIAVEAHRGKKDRYGAPYILHPLRVMSRLSNPRAQIVAVLHDVVEDTHWTFDALKQEGFPDDVIEALKSVTKQQGEDYEHFVQRSAGNPLGRKIKIADLEDNMDARRMNELGEGERQRLEKYLKAWRTLTGS